MSGNNPNIDLVEVCRAGLDFVGCKCVGRSFFLKGRIAKSSVFGWLEAFQAVKLSLQHPCEKANMRF